MAKYLVPDGMLEAATQELSDVGFRSDVIMYDAKRMLNGKFCMQQMQLFLVLQPIWVQ